MSKKKNINLIDKSMEKVLSKVSKKEAKEDSLITGKTKKLINNKTPARGITRHYFYG